MPAEAMPSELDREAVGLALRALRKTAGISTRQGAEAAGISVPTLGSIERGDHSLTSVSSGNLARLNKAFGISWTEFLDIVVPVYGEYLPHLKAQQDSGITRAVDYDPQPVRVRSITFGGVIGAGLNPAAYAAEAGEVVNIVDFAAIENYDDADLMGLRVSGDSMVCEDARLTIQEGSLAIFHVALAPQPGDIVAAWLENEGVGVLKVYQPEIAEHIVLESYNKRHLPIIVSGENPGLIQGVYVGHIASGRRAHTRKPPVPKRN